MNSTESLVLATAGHIDHGKSSLVFSLTGINPDRLPDEKKRGMTTDLGFAQGDGYVFVDCPGHGRYLRHTLAGLYGVDGVCLVIDALQGPQEQTYEHLFAIHCLKISHVLIVISKTDLLEHEALESLEWFKEFKKELSKILNPEVKTDFHFWNTTQNPKDISLKIKSFFKKQNEISSTPRFFFDRHFILNGAGTVITGTHSGWNIIKGDELLLWSRSNKPTQKVTVKSLKSGATSLNESSAISCRLALGLNGIKTKNTNRGDVLIKKETVLYDGALVHLNTRGAFSKKSFKALVQLRTLSVESLIQSHKDGILKIRFPFPVPVEKNDVLFIRRPHRVVGFGYLMAGGAVQTVFKGKLKSSLKKINLKQIAEKNNTNALGTLNVLLEKLYSQIHRLKWSALLTNELISQVKDLVVAKKIFDLGDKHFLSYENVQEFHSWLTQHFSKNKTLNIDEARKYFGVSRQFVVRLLEFSDRQHWTFRKGLNRQAFKLSTWPQVFLHPKHVGADEKLSDPLEL